MSDDEELEYLRSRVELLENALKWLRFRAGLHYLGAAFEPEHMRDLANLAADVLAGVPPELPEFEETMAEAKREGIALSQRLRELTEGER